MGFMKTGDWTLNSDCGGWFVQNSLPAVGIPRDYNSNLSCSLTTCAQPPEQSSACVLRYARPQSAVIHYAPGATGTYNASSPADANPGLCSTSVVHAGAGPEDQVVLMSTNDSHIPEDKMFANADAYFSTTDCFANGVRSDDPNKSCRTGAIILLSDTFQACGADCSQNATSKYLVSLKAHHVPVYVISLGVPEGTAQATEAHCIAQTSGSEDATHQGVFPVTSTDPEQVSADLTDAFTAILTRINEATEDFASATISSVQAGNGQMAYLATFNARKARAIWDGALRAYKLMPNGAINPAPVAPDTHAQNADGSDCVSTVRDLNDPLNNVVLDSPCNQFPTLQWNAQINLAAVPLAPSNPSGVADLAAGATLTRGSDTDSSNDTSTTYPCRITQAPHFLVAPRDGCRGEHFAGDAPDQRRVGRRHGAGPGDHGAFPRLDTSASYWSALKLLITPQTAPPLSGRQTGCGTPPCLAGDNNVSQSIRFIRGDRDTVIKELRTAQSQTLFPSGDAHYYASPSGALKLGDIFHSNPQLIGEPENVFYHQANLHGYQAFFNQHQHRRRVLFAGANDGLLHAFDVGVWDRDTSVCTGGLAHCYDFGTGAELFAYVPRGIMQVFRRLKNAIGVQTKNDEWTVDGAPSAADVFIDAAHNGTPVAGNRAWHSILVGTLREGTAFEGQTPCPAPGTTTAFQNSASSVYALDVTQPEPRRCGNETSGSSRARAAWTAARELVRRPGRRCFGNPGPERHGRERVSGHGESWSKPGPRPHLRGQGRPGNCTDERYVAIFGGGFDRERQNRRGNWIYIVDVETGFVLYKAKSGTANFGSSNVAVNFASVPSETSSIDLNNDGLLDFVYFGDMLGQMWRLDLRSLKIPTGAPTTRWTSKLQNSDGSALSAMLIFQAPQPVSGSTQYFPIYYRPSVVYLGLTTGGQPILGVGFGTGDRDDIIATCDATTRSTSYNQRFYFVVDKANTVTVTESTTGMLRIANSAAGNSTTTPAAGWYLVLGTSTATLGERVITDSLAVNKYIYFFTQSPASGTTGGACPPPSTCTIRGGLVRQLTLVYANGNTLPSATDRAATVANASFATNPIFYVSADQSGNVAFTTNHGVFQPAKTMEPTRSNVKDWKEN